MTDDPKVGQIYIFISDSHSSVRAFTSDATGGSLPADYAPWYAANGGKPINVSSKRDPVARAVQRDGYFLVSTKDSTNSGRKSH